MSTKPRGGGLKAYCRATKKITFFAAPLSDTKRRQDQVKLCVVQSERVRSSTF